MDVLYNIMRKKAPSQPRVLQNGMLSKASNIDTTPHHYIQAIKENHNMEEGDELTGQFIMNNYGDILATLMNKQDEKPFFQRVAIRRTQQELENIARQVHYVGLEMVRPSTIIYPNPAWNTCNFCSFKAPCLAMNAGAAYETILDAEFRPRRIWDPLSASEGKVNG